MLYVWIGNSAEHKLPQNESTYRMRGIANSYKSV